VAAVLVVLALAAALRRVRDVVIAALVVVGEVAAVLGLFTLAGVPLHAYSALVLPVLLGITVDEGMFLLHRAGTAPEADAIETTLREEGPPIAATALTTAAGFGALVFADFDGLRDLGTAGALGSIAGLVMALVVVPVGLRLLPRGRRESSRRRDDVQA
jgi:predicted RND superfamily exporter protein